MKAIVYRTVQIFCFAKFFATAALCLMIFTSPALAAALSYAAPKTSSEITGNLTTKFFSAKIHLVEANNQLMLAKLINNAAQPYPIDFSFKGNGWSAALAMPIHMEIRDAFNDENNYSAIVRANVNFTTTEIGQTETRRGLATLRLQKSAGDWLDDGNATVSLNIVDAADNSITLYNSGHEFAMTSADGNAVQTVENGDFTVMKRNMNLAGVPLYEAQVYNGQIYSQSYTADTVNDAMVMPVKHGLAPTTEISLGSVPAVQPITEISFAPAPVMAPMMAPAAMAVVAPTLPLSPNATVIPSDNGQSPRLKTPVSPPSFAPVATPAPINYSASGQEKTPDLSGGSFLLRHTQQ